jgi:hypothetical protein
MVDRKTLLAEFRYEPDTGLVFRRISRGPAKPRAGQPLSTIGNHGYIIGSVRGTRFLLHRAIWLMIYGTEPNQIDHIDGDRTNNRLGNLRSVTQQQNLANKRRLGRANTSGALGVSLHRRTGKFRAARFGRHLGLYSTVDEASAAYWRARAKE